MSQQMGVRDKSGEPRVRDAVTPENNPANNARSVEEIRKRRIPYSSHQRRLEVRPLPGYQQHWFKEKNVEKAQDAGWVCVDKHEVYINSVSTYGGLRAAGGNTDLGSNVSVVGDSSTGERLVLMKLPMELWLEDQARDDEYDARILSGIFSGELVASPVRSMGPTSGDGVSDTAQATLSAPNGTTYVGRALFQRPSRKIRLMGGQAANPVGLNTRDRFQGP